MWQGWTLGVLGLWLAVAPLLAWDVTSNKVNNALVGLIVALVAWYVPADRPWLRWGCTVVGSWMFTASFFPCLAEGSAYGWNNLVSGTAILLIAAGGYALRQTRQPEPSHHRPRQHGLGL